MTRRSISFAIRFSLLLTLVVLFAWSAVMLPLARSSDNHDTWPTHVVGRGDLAVSVTEQGTLESANNAEIKCKVRGDSNTIIWVVENGTRVEAGDELVRLETLLIEEEINERIKYFHLAQAAAARTKADVARAKLAISEYLEGQFVTELAELNKNLAVAESQLLSAQNRRDYAKMMAESDYVSELEVEEREFAVDQAGLAVQLNNTQIDVLERFTKEEQLATLVGELNSAIANHEADKERAIADEQRLRRAEEELEHCVVQAERDGLVIYPSGRDWEQAPRIEEGATVHKDQVLLLMPDLSQMQVKVGIHESTIDRIQPGLAATIHLPGRTLQGTVRSVSPVTQPAGWWTGNVVKFDTMVDVPSAEGLKPGMSVGVEIVLARHAGVLLLPTSAVLQSQHGFACWVKRGGIAERRTLQLGDSSHWEVVVEAGVQEGEEVILDPLAYLEQARQEAAELTSPQEASTEGSEGPS